MPVPDRPHSPYVGRQRQQRWSAGPVGWLHWTAAWLPAGGHGPRSSPFPWGRHGGWSDNRGDSPAIRPEPLSIRLHPSDRVSGRLVRRRVGLEVAVYVDDFLLGGASKEKVARGLEEVRDLFGHWVLSSRTRSQLSRHSRRTSLAFDGMLWPRRSRCQRRGGGSIVERSRTSSAHPSQGPDGGPQWAGFSSCGRLVPPL